MPFGPFKKSHTQLNRGVITALPVKQHRDAVRLTPHHNFVQDRAQDPLLQVR